jgi:predicted dehydrogenase
VKTYRAAVIGLGRMGSTFDDEIEQGGSIFLPYCHAPAYKAATGTELVAGADPHPEQRSLFAQRWDLGADRVYADYREMLEQEKPDIVSVCTTARLREEIVTDLAAAGVKAIWAEKPIALSLNEADGMLEACRRAGTVVAVNCARRWNPFYAEARRLIEAGELGDILQVTGYGQCGLSHNGSHLIDILRYLAGGQVEWVFGEMVSDQAAAGDEDLMGNGYLAFDNGVRGYMRGMPCGAANWDIEVIGTQGRFRFVEGGPEVELVKMQPGGRRGRGVPVRYPFPWPARLPGMGVEIIENIIGAVEGGDAPRCNGDDALAALEIAVALRQSHRLGGCKVELPMADRSLRIVSAETKEDEVPARVRRESSS